MTTTTAPAPAISTRADLTAALCAAVLGLGLLFAAGFSHAAAVHDVAHDSRHAIGFPCH